jgi:hypothetical protein
MSKWGRLQTVYKDLRWNDKVQCNDLGNEGGESWPAVPKSVNIVDVASGKRDSVISLVQWIGDLQWKSNATEKKIARVSPCF